MSMIYFTKRVNSVKDLFYKNVEYKTLHGLLNDLQKTKNWLCEYNFCIS